MKKPKKRGKMVLLVPETGRGAYVRHQTLYIPAPGKDNDWPVTQPGFAEKRYGTEPYDENDYQLPMKQEIMSLRGKRVRLWAEILPDGKKR